MRTDRKFSPTPRHQFIVPLSQDEKDKLILLSRASGISMSDVIRQLLLREFAGTRVTGGDR